MTACWLCLPLRLEPGKDKADQVAGFGQRMFRASERWRDCQWWSRSSWLSKLVWLSGNPSSWSDGWQTVPLGHLSSAMVSPPPAFTLTTQNSTCPGYGCHPLVSGEILLAVSSACCTEGNLNRGSEFFASSTGGFLKCSVGRLVFVCWWVMENAPVLWVNMF